MQELKGLDVNAGRWARRRGEGDGDVMHLFSAG